MDSATTLVWFRQDLRLTDNPALHYAASAGRILPIYILDDHTGRPMGSASRWWLHHSLQQLDMALQGRLQLFIGKPVQVLPELLRQTGISSVVWNRCYEPAQIARDRELKESLTQQDITVKSFNSHLLWEPWQVLKQDGTAYRVFTPFYRKGCLQQAQPHMPLPRPAKINFYQTNLTGVDLKELKLLPDIGWHTGMAQQWRPGEAGAARRLSRFIKKGLCDYRDKRDIPVIQGTSLLSPHLHFGELSPHQVWYAALHGMEDSARRDSLDCFLSELGWREFSYYLLYHFPELPVANFQAKFNYFPWRSDQQALRAWQRGRTGIPIVDAGMRELWQTGYMHNRVRMIAGSFLVKNLLLHWREGEAWFWDCLVDADLAGNSAGWQWVAGSGADAAPYFRIFNPVTQGQKFDPNGHYIKRFCPELSKIPAKYIHNPWQAPATVLQAGGITLGKEYPAPIVDLKLSRERALNAFQQLKHAPL